MSYQTDYKVFMRKEVDLKNLRNTEELGNLQKILTSIKFRYMESKSYLIKLAKQEEKVIKERQNRIEVLRSFINFQLKEQLFSNKFLLSKKTGTYAVKISIYIDSKFEDVLLDVLRSNELSAYEITTHSVNYALKKSFDNIPMKVTFRKKVLS